MFQSQSTWFYRLELRVFGWLNKQQKKKTNSKVLYEYRKCFRHKQTNIHLVNKLNIIKCFQSFGLENILIILYNHELVIMFYSFFKK